MRVWKPDVEITIDPELIALRGGTKKVAERALTFSQKNADRRLVKVLVNNTLRYEVNITQNGAEVWQRTDTFNFDRRIS